MWHLLAERGDGPLIPSMACFGPVNAAWHWVLHAGKLRLIVRRWSVFGIPLPVGRAPRGDSYEYAEDGRFHFHVEIAHPFTGLIIGYRGWLVPLA